MHPLTFGGAGRCLWLASKHHPDVQSRSTAAVVIELIEPFPIGVIGDLPAKVSLEWQPKVSRQTHAFDK